MDEVQRPILQGEYKLIKIIEKNDDSTLYYGMSVAAQECRFAVREFKVDAGMAPDGLAEFVSYFQSIAQGYMDIGYPGIISLRDFFYENGYMYFVCNFVPGYRLSEILAFRKNCPFTEIQAANMALQIADSLQYMHTMSTGSLFFADMNASNIIVSAQGKVLLSDFGLGKLVTKFNPEAPRMGTVGYAAPEQFGPNGVVNAATDIYSLGVLMHQLVTGIDPTDDPNVILPVQKCNPAISYDYASIVATATDNDPSLRYANIAKMRNALQSIAPRRGVSRKSDSSGGVLSEVVRAFTAPFKHH